MINKKTLIILIIVLVIIVVVGLVSCNKVEEIQGINIFNKDKNYITDFIPDKKTSIRKLIDEEIEGEISVITANGSLSIVSPNTHLETDRKSVIAIDDNEKIKEVKGI